MQKLFRSLIAVGGLMGLAACGDDVSVTEPPPPPLTISGAPVTAVQVGARVQLSASEAVTWASSAANVASVDANGLVTAAAAGTASITATATADVNRKASVTITVTAPAVRSVEVSPTNAILKPGDTQTFVANVDADPGVARTVTWASSNAAVATVTAAGVVSAVSVGSATITATSTAATTVSGAAAITVRAPVAATISVSNITQANVPGAPTVNVNNVAGAIDVNLNVDPGEQVVSRVEVLLDGNVACTQNLSGAQSEELRMAGAFDELEAAIVSCQINTAAFSATTGVANFPNGGHTLSARAIIQGGTQTATPSTQLVFNNTSGVVATVANTNGSDAASAINPATGLQWIGGGATVSLVGVSYVSGTTVASVTCTIFGKNATNVVLTNGTGTLVYTETSNNWSATNTSLTNYLSPAAGETILCPAATLSNGQPMAVPSGSTLLNFGPFPGQQNNASMPVLQVLRMDNNAPGVASSGPAPIAQTAIVLGAANPWVTSTTSLAPAATGGANTLGIPSLATLNANTTGTDIEEGVDNVAVTVNVPAAGGALPTTGGSCNITGLTAVTTGSQLAETTVSTAYPSRIVFKDALGNQTCLDQTPIGADFVAPTLVSVAAPANGSAFTAQASVTDFSFSVTDNASGFGASPIRIQIVRLDSANAAFCVLGGTNCATTNAALTFDATNSLTNSGYYTATYAVRDQAGNTTSTTTITYLLDQVAPAWAGGVSLPSVIAGATSNTFTATPSDNLDLASVWGVVDYPGMDVRYPSQSLGSFGGPLEMGGSAIGYSVSNWIRCLNTTQNDTTTVANKPTQITLFAADQAGGTASVLSPVFGANAQNCNTVGNTLLDIPNGGFGALIATLPAGKTEVDIDGANMLTTSVTTATLSAIAVVPINTSVDPFARVEFYYETAPASNVWRLAGSATGVLAQSPTTRTYTYTFTWDPDANVPAGTPNIRAIGVDAQGDAVVSNTIATLTIVP